MTTTYTNQSKSSTPTYTNVSISDIVGFLLKEDGGIINKQDGGAILLEQTFSSYTNQSKSATPTYTNQSKS